MVSSSAWRWRVRWSSVRAFFCWMSPCPIWMKLQGRHVIEIREIQEAPRHHDGFRLPVAIRSKH